MNDSMKKKIYRYMVSLLGIALAAFFITAAIWGFDENVDRYVLHMTAAVLCGVIIYVVCAALAKVFAERVVKPFKEGNMYAYEEITPLRRKNEEQKRALEDRLLKLATGLGTIDAVSLHMKEGLILVSKDRTISALNEAALTLLSAPRRDFIGHDLIELYRNGELIEAINSASEHKSSVVEINNEDRSLCLYVNPVFNDLQPGGAVILIIDVTQARRAEEQRRDFTANVSHELKTPLTSIAGYAEIIEAGMATAEETKRFAGLIRAQSSRLVSLADDIMRLSEIESGEKVLKMEDIELLELGENIAGELRPAAGRNKVSLEILQGSCVYVHADRRMMEELLINLIDNAIKYNKPGGCVKVAFAEDGDYALIKVSDTGVGIPKEDIPRVFERFYRVDKSRSKKTGGTGLGLAIVKHIAEVHNGSVSIESKEGEGSTFTVRIPQSKKILTTQ